MFVLVILSQKKKKYNVNCYEKAGEAKEFIVLGFLFFTKYDMIIL
jgi:hypothetical protein